MCSANTLVLVGGTLVYRGLPVSQMLAYPIQLVGLLIGRSRYTIWRAIAAGHLRVTKERTVLRTELERWLTVEPAPKRRGRPCKIQTPATI